MGFVRGLTLKLCLKKFKAWVCEFTSSKKNGLLAIILVGMELSRNGIYRETLKSLKILKYNEDPLRTWLELLRDHSY